MVRSLPAYFALITAFVVFSAGAAAAQRRVAVIVHKSSSVDSLTHAKLARIYKGKESRWPDGQKIVAVNLPPASEDRRLFYTTVLDEDPTKKFFRPGDPMPFKTVVLRSPLAVKRFISRIPNAIGYLDVKDLDDTVKILKIDNLSPFQKGYSLSE